MEDEGGRRRKKVVGKRRERERTRDEKMRYVFASVDVSKNGCSEHI